MVPRLFKLVTVFLFLLVCLDGSNFDNRTDLSASFNDFSIQNNRKLNKLHSQLDKYIADLRQSSKNYAIERKTSTIYNKTIRVEKELNDTKKVEAASLEVGDQKENLAGNLKEKSKDDKKLFFALYGIAGVGTNFDNTGIIEPVSSVNNNLKGLFSNSFSMQNYLMAVDNDQTEIETIFNKIKFNSMNFSQQLVSTLLNDIKRKIQLKAKLHKIFAAQARRDVLHNLFKQPGSKLRKRYYNSVWRNVFASSVHSRKYYGSRLRKTLMPWLAKYANKFGVPVKVVDHVIKIESSYRPWVTGSVGEIGLMQIKYDTAKFMGYKGLAKDLYKVDNNLKYGIKYLARAYALARGSVCRTVMKYNGGLGRSSHTTGTKVYCSKIKALMAKS